MDIGILGMGRVGTTLAVALAGRGHRITIGHRDPQAARAKWQGPAVAHAAPAEAAAAAELVINAMPGDVALEVLTSLGSALTGKILLDVSNATARRPGGLLHADGSLAERLQAALPRTQVVKALNTMLFSVMVAPRSLQAPAQAFVSGDDEAAKAQVRALLEQLDWPAEWIVDIGGIESARATEALVLMVPYLIRARGFRPFALTAAC